MTIHNPPSTIFYPSYDGNGSIAAWTQSGAAAPSCLREYDSFGNVVVEHGTPPCGIGFSTKIEDPETGLLYYGHRYLSPLLGRWLSTDPIEEEGAVNLYGFVGNDGVGRWDWIGLQYGLKPNLKDVTPEAGSTDEWPDKLPGGVDCDCKSHKEFAFRFYSNAYSERSTTMFKQFMERLPVNTQEALSDGQYIAGVGSMGSLLQVIKKNLRDCQCISSLSFVSHGNEQGPVHRPKQQEMDDPTKLGQLLKPLMCPASTINMLHCGSTVPTTFAPRLAEAAGVTVVGISGGEQGIGSGEVTESTDPDMSGGRTRIGNPNTQETPYFRAVGTMIGGAVLYRYHPDGRKDKIGTSYRINPS